jgi:hypothetical protein
VDFLMDAERWKRVDDLLQAALAMPAERQEEFLRQQCGNDSALPEEVRSLLTSDRQAGSFLELPACTSPRLLRNCTVGVTQSGSSSSFTGHIVSHYRVLGPVDCWNLALTPKVTPEELSLSYMATSCNPSSRAGFRSLASKAAVSIWHAFRQAAAACRSSVKVN